MIAIGRSTDGVIGATAPDPAWLEELFALLRIPSVSADPTRAADVYAAAHWIRDFVRRAGGSCELVPTKPHALVVGEIPASPGFASAPTVIIYGHFDVQPPGPDDAWESPPFVPSVRDGWIYARGAADDKGNLFLLLKAVELLARERALPVNVRIACDGEEEILGNSIVDFIDSDSRGGDACLIFDGAMVKRGCPAFYLGTRGLVFLHLELRTGRRDLHSGFFGGAALNAAHALMEVLEAVVPVPAELRIGVVQPTEDETAAWRALEPGANVLAAQGAVPTDSDASEEFYVRTFAAPAVVVSGFTSGEAMLQKNIVPVEAVANVQIRTAPEQDVEAVAAAFEQRLRSASPPGAELSLERWAASPGALIRADSLAVSLAADAFERALGVRPLLVRTGGTLPVLAALAARGIPTVLTGFDLPEGNVHAPNERLLLDHITLGVAAARETLLAFANLKTKRRSDPRQEED